MGQAHAPGAKTLDGSTTETDVFQGNEFNIHCYDATSPDFTVHLKNSNGDFKPTTDKIEEDDKSIQVRFAGTQRAIKVVRNGGSGTVDIWPA